MPSPRNIAEAPIAAAAAARNPVEILARPSAVGPEQANHRTAALLRALLGHVADDAAHGIPYALTFNLPAVEEALAYSQTEGDALTAGRQGAQD